MNAVEIAIAIFTGLSALFLWQAARAPFKVLQEQRRDAAPSIVVEATDSWPGDTGNVPTLYLKPSGNGGIVEGLKLRQSTSRPLMPSQQAKLLFSIRNVGRSASTALRVPLKFSFLSTRTSGDPTNLSTLGLEPVEITHIDELSIAALPPASQDYRVFIVSEIGLQVTVESTGEAFDVEPVRKTARTLAASSPTKIILPAAQ